MIINAYCNGYFPMNTSEDPDNPQNNSFLPSDIRWFRPDPRAVIFIKDFHISRSLKRLMKKNQVSITYNHRFEQVIRQCADLRNPTWLSDDLIEVYCQLYDLGYALSVEVIDDHNQLIGGLFGVSIKRAFFAESMYHLRPNMSKVAMVGLVDFLIDQESEFFDCQFITDHLKTMGAKLIDDQEYIKLLQLHLT